jgi:hypothetical protein
MTTRNDPKGVQYDRPPKLGELLLAQGAITNEQLAAALERQKTSGRRLGEELIHAGVVKRSVVNRALRVQRRIGVAAICSALAVSTISHDIKAATVSVSVSATIVPVHCNEAQRAHIRACGIAEEQTAVAPYKTMETSGSATREGYAPGEEIKVDPSRKVRIKTLLY